MMLHLKLSEGEYMVEKKETSRIWMEFKNKINTDNTAKQKKQWGVILT